MHEILRALDEERSEGSQKLFPIYLDTHIFSDEIREGARVKVKAGEWRENWIEYIHRDQAIDLSQWQDEEAYQKALRKLLHDLNNPQQRTTQ